MHIFVNGIEGPCVVHLLTRPSLCLTPLQRDTGCSTSCPLWGVWACAASELFPPTVHCQFYLWNTFAMCPLWPFTLPTLLTQFTFASRLGCCYNILPEHSALSQLSPSIFLRGIIRASKFSTLIKSRPSLGCRFLVAFIKRREVPTLAMPQPNMGQAKAAPLPTCGFSHCNPCLPFCSLLLTRPRLAGLLSGFWGPDALKPTDSSLWSLLLAGTHTSFHWMFRVLGSTPCCPFHDLPYIIMMFVHVQRASGVSGMIHPPGEPWS